MPDNYLSADRKPELIGTVTLRRTGEYSWLGWFGGWKITITRTNPLPMEGDRQYRGPWTAKVGQRKSTWSTIEEARAWIEMVLREVAEFVGWARNWS